MDRKVRIITFYLTLSLFVIMSLSLFAQDKKDVYTIKYGDTLQYIARNYYYKQSKNEPIKLDNTFRWLLIYKENKDQLNFKITFRDFGWNPIVIIEPNQSISIPIYEGNFPSPSELKNMIYEEMKNSKLEIKRKYEAPELQKKESVEDYEIKEITFIKDASGNLTKESITYNIRPYILKDGTALPNSCNIDFDIFVWKIIEHPTADKTVIIFPDTYKDFVCGFKRLLAMKSIADANKEKNISVLLEATDSKNDSLNINKFYELRKYNKFFNFSRIISEPFGYYRNTKEKRVAMNPSIALFYLDDRIDVVGAEDESQINEFLKNEKELKKKFSQNYKKYEDDILKEFNDYHKKENKIFIKRIEDSIIKSTEENNIIDEEMIFQINKLQVNFAKLFLSINFLNILLEKHSEKSVINVLKSIDELCESDTFKIYTSYKKNIMINRKKLVPYEPEKKLHKYKKYLLNTLNNELFVSRDEFISNSFDSLKTNSIGICELGIGHIYNQIALCEEKKGYNLVIYHHPSLRYDLLNYSSPQNPEEHRILFDKYRLDQQYFSDLIIPDYFENQYNTNKELKSLIDKEFIIFKQTDFSFTDNLLKEKMLRIHIKKVSNIGKITRISKLYDKKNIEVKFCFIPEKYIEESEEEIETIFPPEIIGEEESKTLIKIREIEKAIKNL